MKRLLCVLLILFLVPACVTGETIDSVLMDFNVAAKICGAPELGSEYNRTSKATFDMLEFVVSSEIITGFTEKGGEISGGYVVCLDSAKEGEFLALCATHFLTFCGYDQMQKAYANILDMFLETRQGKETTEVVVGNMMIEMFAMKTGLAFNYSIVK